MTSLWSVRRLIPVWVLLTAIPISVYGSSLGFSSGFFKFNATDFYYPNFYDEIGLRSEINYDIGNKGANAFRFQYYAYPGDDNINEFDIEYSYTLIYALGKWGLEFAPAGGIGLSKLQYPAPYYPTVTHQYLLWARGGGEVSLSYSLTDRLTVGCNYRFRSLYYLGSSYGAFVKDEGGNPLQLLHSPYGSVKIRVNDNWTIIGRAGVEYGGYYDAIFLTPDKKSRPFADLGFVYSW